MATSSALPPPPYVGFGIFQGVVDTLSQSTVPSGPLDRRVLDGLSGADYGALISAMRFLGYTDEQRKATPEYAKLVAAYKNDKDQYKLSLSENIFDKYRQILDHIDLDTGTISELEKAFKDAGVTQGQMLTKTIRFWVKALTECGIVLSPHITRPKRTPAPRKNGNDKSSAKAKKKIRRDDGKPDQEQREEIPEGVGRLPIPGVADAFIQYPSALTSTDCDLFEAMIAVLRTYAKGRAASKDKKS